MKKILLVGLFLGIFVLLTGCVNITAEYDLKYNQDSTVTATFEGDSYVISMLYSEFSNDPDVDTVKMEDGKLILHDVIDEEMYSVERSGSWIRRTYTSTLEVEDINENDELEFEIPFTIRVNVPGNINSVSSNCAIRDKVAVCKSGTIEITSSCWFC